VLEDTTTSEVKVSFVDQIYWSTQSNAGIASATFNTLGTQSVVMDHTLTTLPSGVTDGIVIGVTDGDDTVGVDVAGDISSLIGTGGYFTAPGNAPESIGENFNAGTAVDLGITNWLDTGIGLWSVF
jgi:hypothetical protein